MDWKMPAVFAVISFFGVGSLVYFLLCKDEEEDVLLDKKAKTVVEKIIIPKHIVGAVIGRGGSTIKELEMQSGASLHIVEDMSSADFKSCVIRGTPECVQYAVCLIQEIILSQSYEETLEMYVPSFACGRIIGRRGDSIHMIQMRSKAKLSLESNLMSSKSHVRKLIIKGTLEQIHLAKNLVEQKLVEEMIFRSKKENLMLDEQIRKKSRCGPFAKGGQTETYGYQQKGKSINDNNNDFLEVYLSAIESPDRFWLQKAGSCSVELSKLVEEMTDYYSQEENKELHKLENLKLDQIVAVVKSNYNKWFRAKVLDIQIESNAKEPEILLYNVDFGDTEKYKKEDVYELKTDFLKLEFQAIECTLAKVKPRDSTWSEEATTYLKGLKHFWIWHSLAAKILKHEKRLTGTENDKDLTIPCVELYDIHQGVVVNVAEVLVEKGFAIWKEEVEEEEDDDDDDDDDDDEEEEEEKEVESSKVENWAVN